MTSQQAKQTIQLVIVVIGLGVFYGGFEYYDFLETTEATAAADLASKEKKLSEDKGEMSRLRQFASNIETVKQELKNLNLQLDSALEHMPRQFELSALLRKLSALAENSGVDISSFKPKKNDASATTGFYTVVEVEFEIEGGFSQMLTFFDQVLRLKRIVNIDELSIKAKQADNGIAANASTQLLTRGLLKTYRFTN